MGVPGDVVRTDVPGGAVLGHVQGARLRQERLHRRCKRDRCPGPGCPLTCLLQPYSVGVYINGMSVSARCPPPPPPPQLPRVNVSLNVLSNYVVMALSSYLVAGYARVVVGGGVGKNGSTVAVSSSYSVCLHSALCRLCCMLHVACCLWLVACPACPACPAPTNL